MLRSLFLGTAMQPGDLKAGTWLADVQSGEVEVFPVSGGEGLRFKTANAASWIHPDDIFAVTDFARRLDEAAGDWVTVELRVRGDTEDWRWILATGCKKTGAATSNTFEGTACDISDLKREQQRRQEAVHRMARFVAATSHDLQAPLRHIGMYASILANELGEADSKSVEMLKALEAKAVGLQKQIRAVLSFAQTAHAPKREIVDLNSAMEEAVEILRDEIRATGATVTSSFLPAALGDPDLLSKVFTNLVANALESVIDAPRSVEISSTLCRDRVRVSFKDNGGGIEQEYQERIYDPYWSMPHDGGPRRLGMGLTLVKAALLAMDGDIELTTTGPHGTTFVIELPLAPR